MALDHCPICQKEVLGLIGQDLMLDTFYLSSSQGDQEILAAGVFGLVHVRCIFGSDWGKLWASRIMDNMIRVRKFPLVASTEQAVLLRNEALKEIIAVFRDGWVIYISDRAFHERTEQEGGSLIPVKHEFNLDLSEHPVLAGKLQAAFDIGHSYSILELVAALEITDRLFYPNSLTRGRLFSSGPYQTPSRRKKGVGREAILSTRAEYHIFIPQGVVDLLLSFPSI